MSQNDYNIADGTGAAVLADLNSAFQALASTSSGTSRPTTPYAGQLWLDTDTPSSTVWTLFLYDGADDIEIGMIDTTNNRFSARSSQASDVASAATINLDAAYGTVVDVTGTTTVTAVTLAQGQFRVARFTGALTLTHGASLVLQTSANILTAAGDYAIFAGYASSVVRCVGFFRAAGTPVGGTQRKIVTATRDTSLASSTQSITGAGFAPKGVHVTMAGSTEGGRFSDGKSDGTTQFCVYRNVSTGNMGLSTSYTVLVQDAAGTTQYLGAVTLTSDGCDIVWTKVGSPTGTVSMAFEFWR